MLPAAPLLSQQPRYKGVLEVAAGKAGWDRAPPAGVFRGIAVAQSFGTYVAEVAEVSVGNDGVPKVHRVVAAVDCGMTVNPEIIRRQIVIPAARGIGGITESPLGRARMEIVQSAHALDGVLERRGQGRVGGVRQRQATDRG